MYRRKVSTQAWRLLAMSAVVVFCVTACQVQSDAPSASDRATIVIRGSTTLAPLAEMWAAAYAEQSTAVVVDVIGTGSSEGIDDLIAGRADIAMVSRPMSPEENAAASHAGLEIRESAFACMGIGVIVNVANPVSEMTFAELGDVFSGDIRSWQSVSGPDEEIVVVHKLSGWSPDFFRLGVLGDREFAAKAIKVQHTEEVISEVSRHPWAIGFSDLGESIPAQEQIHLLRLEEDRSGKGATYALRRPLFFYAHAGSPKVQAFIDFALGSDAQNQTFEVKLYPAQEASAPVPR